MNVRSTVTCDFREDWRAFADHMFALEDADPGYMLLNRAHLPHSQKLRYVLAWCTFYNPGIAALASTRQGAAFYDYLRAQYPTAKRASERRHFRGQAGLKALAQWQDLYPKPEALVEACYDPFYTGVRRNMKHMAQMGDYFFWKLADIWDTVFGEPVDFTGCEKYMPKVPKQGADLIASMEWQHLQNPAHVLVSTMARVTEHISTMRHPINARNLKLQEAETVCCVFKQHVNGDYKLGFRSAKAWKRLIGAAPSTTAERKTVCALMDGLTAGGIWTPVRLDEVAEYL